MIDCEFLGFTINAKFNGCTYDDYDKCLNDAGFKRDTYKLPSKYDSEEISKSSICGFNTHRGFHLSHFLN